MRKEGGGAAQFPATPGVYIVYDREGTLQYVGMSRKVASHHLGDCAPC